MKAGNRKKRMGEKGIFNYVVAFAIAMLMLLILVATILPGIQKAQVITFGSQQTAFTDINSHIQALPNSDAKTSLLTSFNTQYESSQTQFDIVAFFIQYWWLFIVLIVGIGTYVVARRNVEFQGF